MKTFALFAAWLCGALACACAGHPKPPPPAQPPVAGVVVPDPPTGPEGPKPSSSEPRKPPIVTTEGYSVWGLGYSLRSPEHRDAVTREPVTVVGYVVATNLADAPGCAVHEVGIADPPECTAPIPAFWLGDRPDAAIADSVKVMGFASNYAQIYDAIREFDRGQPTAVDAFWGQEVPNPLPAVGARVAVTGRFGRTFSMASSGVETDDTMGIVTYTSMQTLEPASELATLSGVTRQPQP